MTEPIIELPEAPCDTGLYDSQPCSHWLWCKAEKIACRDFYYYMKTGIIIPPEGLTKQAYVKVYYYVETNGVIKLKGVIRRGYGRFFKVIILRDRNPGWKYYRRSFLGDEDGHNKDHRKDKVCPPKPRSFLRQWGILFDEG